MKPGDGLNYDCDDRVDEEVLDGVDNDGDGLVDEDLAWSDEAPPATKTEQDNTGVTVDAVKKTEQDNTAVTVGVVVPILVLTLAGAGIFLAVTMTRRRKRREEFLALQESRPDGGETGPESNKDNGGDDGNSLKNNDGDVQSTVSNNGEQTERASPEENMYEAPEELSNEQQDHHYDEVDETSPNKEP